MYKQLIILILGISILFLVGVGVYLQDKANKQEIFEKQIIEQDEEDRKYLNNLLTTHLDEFRKDLKKTTVKYKKSRRVLNEVLSPDNFETPEFTKESYDFFNGHIVPDLRNKSAAIINVFAKYQKKIKEDITNYKTNIGQEFLLQWQEIQKEQLNKYINFFSKEEKIIQAYEKIMEFYYIHSNLFSFDDEKNILIFDREEDKQKEKSLLDTVSELRKPSLP